MHTCALLYIVSILLRIVIFKKNSNKNPPNFIFITFAYLSCKKLVKMLEFKGIIFFTDESCVSMTKKQRAEAAVELLKKEYPEAVCALNAETPFQLIVATRLSAQCTDARVNLVTPALFAKYPTENELAEAEQADVEALIHSCGFFRGKASDLIGMAKAVRDIYGGVLPDTIEELTKLPGVGRKTANLICGDVYKKPAVVADTHLIRITNLLGLVDTKDPKKVELELKKILPPEESSDFCHRVVLHGRAVCIARRPQCEKCCMNTICKSYKGGAEK